MEEEGNKVCFITCNTFGVRGACWNFGMQIRKNDKHVNYSHEHAQTKQQIE
jgi:hypothetical protein